jgi:DNA-binding NarL/FixJ family response regulator
VVVASDTQVVGREDELVRLREFVSSMAEGPSAMVVWGEAGIGKSTLWRAAIKADEVAAFTVLSARCVEAELPLALVGVADLVQDVLPGVADELADHERTALGVALGLETSDDRPPDAIALPRAFLALLRLLARDAPVLIAIDDVQWLDGPSARVVSFAARRLSDARVGILLTQRGDGSDPLDLAHAFDEAHLEEIRLGGLSIGALAHLLRRRLGTRIPRPVLSRVHRASGGNPMFALEFARQLAGRHGPQLGPLLFPASLEELVRTRVSAYPPDIRKLLATAAAVERPTPAMLRSIEPAAETLLGAALDTGALALGEDGVLRFPHPLLASAAYADLTPSQRRALHRRLAESPAVLEERARHLALSSEGPDAQAARVLDEAAAHARARGAPDAAAELADEAVRLTPLDDVTDREERALAVAEYLVEAWRLEDASARIDEFLAAGVSGPRRARALLLSQLVEDDLDVVRARLEEALEHVGDDRGLRARVLLGLSVCVVVHEGLEASEKLAREAATIAEDLGDARLLATALGTVARRAAGAGRPEPALVERALALAETHGTLHGWPTPRMVLGAEFSLGRGDLSRAREVLQAELAAILHEGREYDRASVLMALAELEWRAGRWERVERHLEGLDELADAGDRWTEAFCLVARGRLAAARGSVEEGRRLLTEAQKRGEASHSPIPPATGWALGTLALALGQPAHAWAALADALRVSNFLGFHLARHDALAARADAIEALAALGRLEDAGELLARIDEEAQNGHLWAGPAALRCRALILLARGDPEAVDAAEDAARGFEAAGFPLDRGRALLVAGEGLRRLGARRRAAAMLEAARAIFAGLGAALWVERVERELRRARPRPRRDRELTNAERRVAALVADGRTNREVAAQLFTTVATVEAHLTRIYRKLGVRSRTELARQVADGTVSLAEE